MNYWQIHKKFNKARELAGYGKYDIQMRDLRHKNAVDDSLENANVRLGHASVTMTEKYRNVLVGKIARPIAKLK
jgi:hypothetical protein